VEVFDLLVSVSLVVWSGGRLLVAVGWCLGRFYVGLCYTSGGEGTLVGFESDM